MFVTYKKGIGHKQKKKNDKFERSKRIRQDKTCSANH